MKPRRIAPAKRPARAVDVKRNRAQRRQQAEILERVAKRDIYPEPESDERYLP